MTTATTWRVRALVPIGLADDVDGFDAITAGRVVADALGSKVEAIVLGRVVERDAAATAQARGAGDVACFSHPDLDDAAGPAQWSAAFAMFLRNTTAEGLPTFYVLPACTPADSIAARLALMLSGAAVGRCDSVRRDGAGLALARPSHGGRVVLTVRCEATQCFAVMRPIVAANAPDSVIDAANAVATFTKLHEPLPPVPRVLERGEASREPPLGSARVVVCGGRGIGGPDGFECLHELADVLGGAVGGSLPAVDAGWLPVDRQIGQSGKQVGPDVYLAVGVSGTPQHLAGIAECSRIVAINNDPAADIFSFAEAGVVGTWQDVLPRLLEELRRSQVSDALDRRPGVPL